jgi:hypothetical protein
MLAPTCFDSSLPSSGSFLDPCDCRGSVDNPAHRLHNHTLYDTPPIPFVITSNSERPKKLPDDGRLLSKHVAAST